MTYFALLRAVNLGPHNRVGMADLRAMLAELGFEQPRTLILSGNLVFESEERRPAAIERRIRAAIGVRFGFEPEVFVRTPAEWRRLMASNPFREEAARDPARLLVVCLHRAPPPGRVRAFAAAIAGRERVAVAGRHAYVVYPDGIGRSKLTPALIERHLGGPGTARNWNTVLKLASLAQAGPSGVRQ